MNTSSKKNNQSGTKLIAIVTVHLLGAFLAVAAPLKEGDAFPDLNQLGLEGTVPDIHGKVVLVDFFASWCHPCQESFPAMNDLYQQYAGKDLVIICNCSYFQVFKVHALVVASVAHRALVAGLVNEDTAHGLGGHGKEM